jgi:hypothetical protein
MGPVAERANPPPRRAWSPYVVNFVLGNAVLAWSWWEPLHATYPPLSGVAVARELLHDGALPSATAMTLIFASRWALRHRPDVRLLAALSIVLPLAVVAIPVALGNLSTTPAARTPVLLALVLGSPLATPFIPLNFVLLARGIVPLRRPPGEAH